MNTDTTKRYRLLINLPDGATIGDTYKKVGDRYFNESLDAIKSPVVEHNAYFTWQVENCPTYFEPVKGGIEISDIHRINFWSKTQLENNAFVFQSKKDIDESYFPEIKQAIEKVLNNDTVVNP